MKKKVVNRNRSKSCGGCGATSGDLAELVAKGGGGGTSVFCKRCRTEKGYAFVAIPRAMVSK